jgi:integrase/recombinase XerD
VAREGGAGYTSEGHAEHRCLPKNIFGRTREHIKGVRIRHDFLFGLILNSGLRISEVLSVRVRDMRVVIGIARSVRVIGKGNRERMVPLPESFGQVVGFWLSDKAKEDFVFAKQLGGKPSVAHAVRAYLCHAITRSGIDKKVTPHSSGTPTRRGSWRAGRSSWTSRRCWGT